MSDSTLTSRNRQIADRVEKGEESLDVIATDYGITRERVRQIAYRAGVTPRSKSNALKRAGVVTRFKAGATAEELCEWYGIDRKKLFIWLRQAGIQPPWKEFPLIHGTAGYARKCRCQICRDAYAAKSLIKRHARAKQKVPDDIHGKHTTYSNWSCRCEPCRAAWRLHMREQHVRNRSPEQKARRRREARNFPPEKHGLYGTYTYWGCRCERCRATFAKRQVQSRARAKEKLSSLPEERHGKSSTYLWYGCRCEKCTAAVRVAWRKRR